MKKITHPTNNIGINFLNKIVLDLCKNLGADYVFVGHYKKATNTLNTLSFCNQQKLIENIQYNIKGTPCEEVNSSNFCGYAKGIQSMFPNDESLKSLTIEGFVGYPMFSTASGIVLGSIVLLYKHEIQNINKIEEHLKLVAPRIELELERHIISSSLKEAENKNKLIHKELERAKTLMFESNKLSKVGVWELDLENNNVFWDDSTRKILEIPVDYLPDMGKILNSYKKGESRDRVAKAREEVIKTGKSYDITVEAISGKGKKLWLRILGKGVMQKSKCIRIYGSFQDVTKEKLLEQKLQDQNQVLKNSEQKFKAFFENNSAIILQLNPLTQALENCSDGAIKFYGYSKNELCKKKANEINAMPAEYVKSKFSLLNKLNSLSFETKHILKNKNIRDIDLYASKIQTPSGPKIFTIINDITDKKESESILKLTLKDNENIKIALNQSAILAYTDSKGKITYVNDQFMNISKFNKTELIGKDHRILSSGHHSKKFMRVLWDTIKSGEIWTGEMKNKAKDGSYYWVHTTIVPSINENGDITQYIAIRYDITAKKEAELLLRNHQEYIEQKNEKLEKIVWSFSHNVRAPVATIIGLSNIFNYKDEFDTVNKDIINKIQAPIDSLDKLISSIVEDINSIS